MKVSVCIPVFNADAFLAAAIKSVLIQSHQDFELILLNDGSSDNSQKIIEEFAKKDSRIKVINDGKNQGLIARLNQLVTLSSSEYFVRMDADDVMFPKRLEKQLSIMQNNPAVALVHSVAVSISKDNEILGLKENPSPEKFKTGIIHPTVMTRKYFLLDNPYEAGFPQMEDLELWHRTAIQYEFYYITEPLLFYREDGALVSKKHLRMYEGLINFCKKYGITGLRRYKILFSSRFKYITYKIVEKFGASNLIINFRFAKLSMSEKKKFKEILDRIVNARI